MSAPLLAARGLSLRAGARELVRDLDFTVRRGEVWCLLGANGAGKTTLLETIVGLKPPFAGCLSLAGRPLGAWTVWEAARIRAYLPQRTRDAFGASVLEVVAMGRHPHLSRWDWEGESDAGIAMAALCAMGLSGLAARDVMTLSGGERQRVGIAAAIAQQAPLLLLDEPVAHLDLRHQLAALAHLAVLARDEGRAVMLSVHDLNLAARVATHALLLGDGGRATAGRFCQVATDEALSAAFHHPVTRIRAGDRPVFIAA